MPTTLAAISFLRSIISSIFSSSVPGAEELVHLHVPRLADAEGAVGGLVLHRRVPPAVEVEDVVGPRSGSGRCRRP